MSWISPLFAPYPAPVPHWRNAVVAAAFGLFIFTFLYAFQPFNLQAAYFGQSPRLMGVFGLISAGVILLFLVLLPAVFPERLYDAWRGWHQLAYLLLALLIIATGNGIYLNWLNEQPFHWGDYGLIITQTFGLGLFPLAFLFLLEANYTLRWNQATAASLNATLSAPVNQVNRVSLPGGPDLEIDDLLYARAYGNYVRFVFQEGEEVREHMARITLAAVENQAGWEKLLRCHRSYLVNPGRIARVEGNSQNLQLILDAGEGKVPVSRSFAGSIKAHLRSVVSGNSPQKR